MSYMDVKTAADRWELTERRITTLCRDGRIAGAKKEAGLWLIPDDAEKPVDGRRNKFTRAMKATAKLPLPIGVSDFKELVSGYYYVDKTLMLKEFIDFKPKVSLFTRPRRFGKTLAMDMLKTFFEVSDTDTSRYFKNKKIWSCGEEYRREQGKYPVIFVTFKDIKFAAWEQTYTAIREIIANEYLRHDVLLTSDKCNEFEKDYFRKVVDGTITEVSMARAFLSFRTCSMSIMAVPLSLSLMNMIHLSSRATRRDTTSRSPALCAIFCPAPSKITRTFPTAS